MSDPVTPLGGAAFDGFARVAEIGPLGMISLRARAGLPGLAEAVAEVTGCALPAPRRILSAKGRAVGWMSPDELLLVLPRPEVPAGLARLGAALAGQHHLAVDVSDARAVFRIEGARAGQVLRKLAPADLDRMEADELRRTRLAQVAAAFWRDGEGYTLVTFRSVAGYVMGVLSHAAQPGSALD
jgi:sarcosine oxidase subunit gamma